MKPNLAAVFALVLAVAFFGEGRAYGGDVDLDPDGATDETGSENFSMIDFSAVADIAVTCCGYGYPAGMPAGSPARMNAANTATAFTLMINYSLTLDPGTNPVNVTLTPEIGNVGGPFTAINECAETLALSSSGTLTWNDCQITNSTELASVRSALASSINLQSVLHIVPGNLNGNTTVNISGTGSSQLEFLAPNAIPEPGTFALMAAALALAIVRARR